MMSLYACHGHVLTAYKLFPASYFTLKFPKLFIARCMYSLQKNVFYINVIYKAES
jgi:hypothetical protein